MERFYVSPENIGSREAYVTGEELKHLSRVLRLKPGDPLEIFDGLGRGFHAVLAALEEGRARVLLDDPVAERRDSRLKTCLLQGIPKGEKMEWVVQKTTELGVSAVAPLELTCCVVRLENEKKRRERKERWQKVACEASRQCGRLTVPQVALPGTLKSALEKLRPEDLLLIPWEKGGIPVKRLLEVTPGEKAAALESGRGTVFFLVGPEGGLTKEEVELAVARGGVCLTLGPRILRTETAGTALLTLLQYAWGDIGLAPSGHFQRTDSD
ncbi:MAG: 16S rRNA (uracil(1498)-N(3))-methyltransferase [Peptococcaceae bacterium]|nr:16S rRNA (uracil(1498)-N(3))-methyltransferase [Peptococcaceae bacterium]